jgi:hypothetical protein
MTPLLVALVLAAAALALAGVWYRRAAPVAVLANAAALALGDATVLVTVTAGIAAAVYLLGVHAIDRPPGVVPVPPSALAAMLVFGAAVLLASALPGGLPWWPLIAPVTVLLGYLLAVGPLRRR